MSDVVRRHGLHTICSSGRCPNQGECWGRGTATFMILGDICTRSCRFCATQTGRPAPVDEAEAAKVAESVRLMRLKHCVLTSVDRDDLGDGGASFWAETIRAVRKANPDTTIEVLLPDFDGSETAADTVLAAGPDIAGHNIETVRRLTPQVRSRARYDTSLAFLRYMASAGAGRTRVKSGLMVGLGETDKEVLETLDDLARTGCRLVTIGQYLRPTPEHWPVARYVHPDIFAFYKEEALERGFDHVESAPLVRSSYMAEQALRKGNGKARRDLSALKPAVEKAEKKEGGGQ